MGVLATDNFDRANGALGANWSAVGDYVEGTITSNVVHHAAGDNNAERYTAVTAPADQYARVTLGNLSAEDGEGPGPLVRGASGARTAYFLVCSTANVKLFRVVADSYTQLGSDLAGAANGDVLELQVTGTGTSTRLVGRKNGSTIIDHTDNSGSAIDSGDWGWWISTVTGDPTLDDWQGGDAPGATVIDLASGTSTTSNTTVVTGATVTASVGDWLVVVAASSNDGTNGAASMTTVVDSDAVNTYTQRALINYDPGAAGAGATLGLYTCQVTSALSGDTITVNHSVNTTEKAVQVYRVVPASGYTMSFLSADTTGSTGNASSYTAATVSVTNGDTIFGAAAIETDDAVSGDTDTTNGGWSSIITRLADGGADASTMSSCSQWKTVNATGNQDWACSTSTARDSARTYLILRPLSADTQEWRGSYPPWRLRGPNNIMYAPSA